MEEKDTQAPANSPEAPEANDPANESSTPRAGAGQPGDSPDSSGSAELPERPPEPPADEPPPDQPPAEEPPPSEPPPEDPPPAPPPVKEPPTDEPAVEEPSGVDAGDLTVEQKSSRFDSEASRLRAIVEAAVYITDDPLTAGQIADALEQPVDRVQEVLDLLVADYDAPEHGVSIREVAEGYKMATKPEHHEAIRSFVKRLQKPLKLSMAALETLAVIAYRQPITAPEIMEIRGVQGAGVLKTLLDRKLIATAGRKNVIGKPILYKTTKEFLVQFGLKNLNELPTLKEFEELARAALSDAEEEPVQESGELPFTEPAAEDASPPEDSAAGTGESPSEDEPNETADDQDAPAERKGPHSDARSSEADDRKAGRPASNED